MRRLPDPAASSAAVYLKAAVVSKVTWRLVPLLFFLYVVAYLDRINIGFAALQIQSQLHLSDASYGFAAGVFFAGYVLFQLPSNIALERIGARRWIAAADGHVGSHFFLHDFCEGSLAAVCRYASCWARQKQDFFPESFFI